MLHVTTHACRVSDTATYFQDHPLEEPAAEPASCGDGGLSGGVSGRCE